MITAQSLREVLHYDPETGTMTWLVKTRSPWQRLNGPAGTPMSNGYRQVTINQKHYLTHRLAWLYMAGEWPPEQVDHINGKRDDNRWSNLRLATSTQNCGNKRRSSSNAVGLKGVCHSGRPRRPYKARIMSKGKEISLGRFDCPAAAHMAYLVAADQIFGEYARA